MKKAYADDHLHFPGQISSLQDGAPFKALLDDLYHKAWNVYCKPPFGAPQQVIQYLGRYTHRVAISNDRIVKLEGDQVTFRYRNWTDGDHVKLMTLPAFEFIRRFLLHILPDGFVKIRYFGLLSNRHKQTRLKRCRQLLRASAPTHRREDQETSWEDLMVRLTGVDPRVCPQCGKGKMIHKEILLPQQPDVPLQRRRISM